MARQAVGAERPFTIEETADLLGRYRAVELACFELLGERAPRAVAPAAVVALAGAARAHAWRAGIFEALLPVSVGLPDAESLTRLPSVELEGVLEELVRAEDAALVARLTEGLYPAFAASWSRHLARCSASADPPVARALERALDDLGRVRSDLVAVAEHLEADRSANGEDVERRLAATGGPFGEVD